MIRRNEDLGSYAGRVIESHQAANAQLEADGQFYEGVRREFGRQAPDAPAE